MKSQRIQPGVNWHAVQPTYQDDRSVKLTNTNITSRDGVQLNVCDTMKHVVDISTNNQTQLMLIDNVKVSDVINIDTNVNKYPLQFVTYIRCQSFPTVTGNTSYLKLIEETSDSDTREYVIGERVVDGVMYSSKYFEADLSSDNGLYFNVTMHDDETLSLNHNDNYENVYMTVSGTPQDSTDHVYFTTAVDNIPGDDQKFGYFYDATFGYLTLYKTFNKETFYLTPVYDDVLQVNVLTFTKPTTGLEQFPYDAVNRVISPDRSTSQGLTLFNTWVSYNIFGDQNTLDVNETKSYTDVYNNYLLSSPLSLIDNNKKNYNILQLKNQLTPDNNQSRSNPFPFYTRCDHREYDKLFTGTNQIYGDDNISTSYNSYVTTIDLKADHITYFHTPQNMYPYNKININDCGLIESGAIGGDTPIVSDKIFKKAAAYKYNTPWGAPLDEETGVWLCSWLRSNTGTDWSDKTTYERNLLVNFRGVTYKCKEENTNVQPNLDPKTWEVVQDASSVWVDRYYNPKHYTAQEALRVEGQYYEYISKFDFIVEKLKADKHIVFDKKSDLCLEPGSLYAYYRVGSSENKSIINTVGQSLVHEGVTPAYTTTRDLYQNVDSDKLIVDGDVYIETKSLNKTTNSDFTLSMHVDTQDWTQPIGSQIIGNYTNHGVGLFNKMNTTPYIIMSQDMYIHIYNTSLEHINTITTDHMIIKAVHLEGSENIFALTDVNLILQYDFKGMLVERFQIPPTAGLCVDLEIDHDSMYLLEITGDLRRFQINNELQDLLYTPWPDTIIGQPGTMDPVGEHYTHSSRTAIVPYGDLQYRVNCDLYTMDLSGNMWFSKENKIYKMLPSSKQGINSTFVDTVNGLLISLITEEKNLGATKGNSITIVCDGTQTLQQVVDQWNTQNPDNQIQTLAFESLNLTLPAGYTIDFSGGVDRGTTTITYGLSSSPDNRIVGLKSDEHDNLWVLTQKQDQTKIHKYDTDRRLLYMSGLSAIDSTLQYNMSGHNMLDLVTEFNQGVYDHYALILNQSIDSAFVNVTKIDLNGQLISTTQQTIPHVVYNPVDQYTNVTNHETVKNLFHETINENYIMLKIRYENYFDTDRTYNDILKYKISDLTSGGHHFAASFNSLNGNLSLFVDGDLRDTATSDDVYTGAAYKFTKTIHTPLYVGCDSYFNNITLSEHLKKPNYNFAGGITISGLRTYNAYLNFHKVRSLAREFMQIQNIKLTVPTGKRSYLDQMTRFYHHRVPGRKSTLFDVDITTESLSADQNQLSVEIFNHMSDRLPVNVKLNNINWYTDDNE